MKPPRISVCIPTYNYARYLPCAIESVLSQRFGDFELIVQDDRSTDDTTDVVRGYASRDARIRFDVNPSRLGLVGNWNRCLSLAGGTNVKFVFADDALSSPYALGKMSSVLDGHPEVSLVGSPRTLVDAEGRVLGVKADFRGDRIEEGAGITRRCLLREANLIGEPSVVMFRRSDAARGFHPEYRHLPDIEMWFHLLERGKFAFIDEPLSLFRVHPGQQTARNLETYADIEDLFLLFRDYASKPSLGLGGWTRRYLQYDVTYRYWKLYKRGIIGKGEMREKIGTHMDFRWFLLILPCYKTYKPFYKAFLRLRQSLVAGRKEYPSRG